MNQLPPELFQQRPLRSDYGRAPSYRTRRVLTIIVILLMVAGGIWRWVLGSPSLIRTGEIPTIKAEGTWKQRPEQPGGLDIPHQDVQVYQALDNKDATKAEVEHLLPPPEVPQMTTSSPVATNKPAPPANAAPQTENLAPLEDAQAPVIDVPSAPPAAIPTTVEKTKTPSAPPPLSTVSAPPPAPVVEAEQPKPAAQVVKKKTVVAVQTLAPAPSPPPPAAAVMQEEPASGPQRVVQFASVQSEESAHEMMQKMQNRYGSILGDGQLRVIQADLGAKGIYYRIQSQPMAESQAGKLCNAVKKLKDGCIIVH